MRKIHVYINKQLPPNIEFIFRKRKPSFDVWLNQVVASSFSSHLYAWHLITFPHSIQEPLPTTSLPHSSTCLSLLGFLNPRIQQSFVLRDETFDFEIFSFSPYLLFFLLLSILFFFPHTRFKFLGHGERYRPLPRSVFSSFFPSWFFSWRWCVPTLQRQE